MGSTFLYPPTKRPIQYTTMPDPTSVNGPSNKRSKPPPPPLHVPQVTPLSPPLPRLRSLLCHASGISGVIGKSGNVIKQLQQLTGAKICGDVGGQEELEVSKAQEALVRVLRGFWRWRRRVWDECGRWGGSCRLLAEANRWGRLLGKEGRL
ncbi:hypothetical protein GH714_008605 [Hevea brasiliensis]|uniref:K Homology domain-containing protein n=1 Tax=Hevea brasiliensis TaxID=3981 RepID=A0A6A6KYZ4_HEVBR|nr:hypothetical protein GH714_008605 [Hevea brasiliensis]